MSRSYFSEGPARALRAVVVFAALAGVPALSESAALPPIKVGVLLPFSGTYAQLGEDILDGMKLSISQNKNVLGGREVEYKIIDGEADPSKAVQNMNRLIHKENVDLVVGPVHSGVGMAMVKVARDTGTILLIPNAGFEAATDALCAKNIFRTAYDTWQISYPAGTIAAKRGFKNVVTLSWDYAAGKDHVKAFSAGYRAAGGGTVKELWVPFPSMEFQSYLSQIVGLKADAVFSFFAGAGAVKFVKDFAAAGLKSKTQLLGPGFLVDGTTLDAQGASADGILTTLHYAPSLDNPANTKFKESYEKQYNRSVNEYAVQGYDTGLVLVSALDQVHGNTSDHTALIKALESVSVDSPRGKWKFSKAHNPIQDIYLREAKDGKNSVLELAAKQLNTPSRACKM